MRPQKCDEMMLPIHVTVTKENMALITPPEPEDIAKFISNIFISVGVVLNESALIVIFGFVVDSLRVRRNAGWFCTTCGMIVVFDTRHVLVLVGISILESKTIKLMFPSS